MKNILKFSCFAFVMISFLIVTSCEDDADKLTGSLDQGSILDISSSSDLAFVQTLTGAGATLEISGSEISEVIHVIVDDVTLAPNLVVKDDILSITVPSNLELGVHDFKFILLGKRFVKKSIELVALPAISYIVPGSASEGETVTVFGNNLDKVDKLEVMGTVATISSKVAGMIKFTMPAGAATGPVKISSSLVGASETSKVDLIACESESDNVLCAPALLLNHDFELGTDDNFDNWGKWNGGTFMFQTTDPSQVYRGARALRVVRDGTLSNGQWRIQFTSDAVATEVDANYIVYIWAKASADGGAFRVSTNPSARYTGDQLVPKTWTQLEFAFTANEASTRIVLDLNGNEAAVTEFYIDDIRLVKQ